MACRTESKWSVEVGSEYGSPVVVDEAFVHSRQADKEVLRALEIDSRCSLGKELSRAFQNWRWW